MVFIGQLGLDENAEYVKEKALENNLDCLFQTCATRPTGTCNMIASQRYKNTIRLTVNECDNANNLSTSDLSSLLNDANLGNKDYIFLTGHFLVRKSVDEAREYIKCLKKTGAKIIFDLVPHDLYKTISLSDLLNIIPNNIEILISKLRTIRGFLDFEGDENSISLDERSLFFKEFPAKKIAIRYGKENNSKEDIMSLSKSNQVTIVEAVTETGFIALKHEERHGFGDYLTAKLVERHIFTALESY